jgi:hypothetical protein
MLTQSLFELAIATTFSSKGLARILKEEHLVATSPSDDATGLHLRCLMQLRDDLDNDHPRRFRKNDLDSAFSVVWPKMQFQEGKLPILDHVFDHLMQSDGDVIHYRPERTQAYGRFAAIFDPSSLVAWKIAQLIRRDSSLAGHDLIRIVDAQQPFFCPLPVTKKDYAEGHVHLNGIHFDGVILMNQLCLIQPKERQGKFAELSRLAHGLLDQPFPSQAQQPDKSQRSSDAFHQAQQEVQKNPSQLWRTWLTDSYLTTAPNPVNWEWIAEANGMPAGISWHWLRCQIARSICDGDLSKAWLWFLIWVWWQYQQEESLPTLRIGLFYLQAELMQLRRQMIMDGQGLSKFVDVFRNELRSKGGGQFNELHNAQRLLHGPNDQAEIKVGPDAYSPKAVKRLVQSINRVRKHTLPFSTLPNSEAQTTAYRKHLDDWHLCLHFARSQQDNKKRSPIWKEAHKLSEKLQSQAGWSDSEFLSGHLNQQMHFQPANWVRGLDVAGDENIAKIELHAPVLRWLRASFKAQVFGTPPAPGFHLSIHAGEDYAHPLSGMRHIDETVHFCEMRSGDRLGHALAIGIPPADWITRQGDMLLAADEHLDNLVWVWQHACTLSSRLDLANRIIPHLERRIRLIGKYVDWVQGNFSLGSSQTHDVASGPPQANRRRTPEPHVLHQAWIYRRNCIHQFTQYETAPLIDDLIKVAVPDWRVLARRSVSPTRGQARNTGADSVERERDEALNAEELYLRRGKAMLAGSPSNRKVLVRSGPNPHWARIHDAYDADLDLLLDYDSAEEIEFMHALQDYLLDQYDAKGLIIEANPSSNVFIARLEAHKQHPIFRWCPPNEDCLKLKGKWNEHGLRRGPMRVCINTDDPGIMPTTLRTEYALLQEAAQELGVSRTDAGTWLERIRQFGLDEFASKHLSVFRPR